ncbi:LysM peptidoglycan-binding domain-containing protein, partial [Arthrobacter sp. B0490]|uniref:LysM peptidoglycan-binding domain-containing protein n=1 Tax=Arthrobacter sp. B0490 TaxID=2058891 RepID=UPI000CE4A2DE
MTRTSILARHRAAVTHSIALEGLSHSAKTGAVALGKPAIIAAATGGLVLAVGAPAQAGTYTQEPAGTTGTTGTVAQAPAAPATAGVHTVVAGDTMGAIASLHGLNLDTLLAQNGLSYGSVIQPGQKISLSGGAAAAVSPATVPAAAPAGQVFYAAPAVAPVAAPAPAAASAAQSTYSLTSAAISPIAPAAPALVAPSVPASGVGAALVASAYGQIGSIQDCTVLVERALRSIGKNVGDLGPT